MKTTEKEEKEKNQKNDPDHEKQKELEQGLEKAINKYDKEEQSDYVSDKKNFEHDNQGDTQNENIESKDNPSQDQNTAKLNKAKKDNNEEKPQSIINKATEKVRKTKNNKKDKPKKKHGLFRRFLFFERLKFKNKFERKFRTLARIYRRIYNKKFKELQEKIDFVNQCKDFFEQATEDTLKHKKEFMSRLEQYELDTMKLVEFFRMFERNKSEIENIAKKISKVEFKTMLDWNRKFKSKFDKLVK